ncbi:phage replisome organizer N-terminal domain-containing protein [Clostridium taeniosporum]|uniref:Phage replisome organiser N-terminal domain-containing protein n=1 Tax=Clostridium taeniosporum TaxID=394958 RepID=A0A1D7XHU3_9CLOT|nr:phage replisome organizer N-terminal domain-containing protein [Clostridium taeniosporum]AOR22882.1 hypothetical protein BGI42_03765 [Clostridium taeniosporum]
MERKIVKLRVDMYNDTKFKIIDTMEERDVIHYIWTRLLTLAGKVNLEGDLYLSKSIPYTVETLALEFNRSAKKVKLALKVFMDLEMVELTENNVYRVRNFVKHQNIRSKKKVDIAEKVKCAEEKLSDINSAKVNKNLIEKTDNNDLKHKVNDVESIVNKEEENSTFDFEKENKNNMVLNISKDIENKNSLKVEESEEAVNDIVISDSPKIIEQYKTKIQESNNNYEENRLKSNGEVKYNNIKKSHNKFNVNKSKKYLGLPESKNNNIKVIEPNNDKKSSIDLVTINVENNSTINSKNISDKLILDENLLNNKLSTQDKVNCDNEFVFSKADNKKKKNKSKKQKRKEEDSDIISTWDGDDVEDICGLSDEMPEGRLITTFKV